MGTGREGFRRDGRLNGASFTKNSHPAALPAGYLLVRQAEAHAAVICRVTGRGIGFGKVRVATRRMTDTTSPQPPGEQPPKKSVFSSETAIGWLQLGALVIGVAALLWSIYVYYVPAPQAVAAVESGVHTIGQSLVEEDYRNLQALNRAVDYVSIYDVNHANFEEGARTLVSFMAVRSVVLRRHKLTTPFNEFSAAFEACRTMPTHENIVNLRRAAAAFAEPLDEALQRFVQAPRGRTGSR